MLTLNIPQIFMTQHICCPKNVFNKTELYNSEGKAPFREEEYIVDANNIWLLQLIF